MLTRRPPPATTTRSGERPARTAAILSRASTTCSSSRSLMPAGTTTLSRSLPLTWTGTSRTSSVAAVSSTSGHVSPWIDDHASPAAASLRDHSCSVICGAAGARIARFATVRIERQCPDAVQEAVHATDPRRAPRTALVPGAHEHQEQPDRVGAVARDELVGILDVATRLAHPLAIGAEDLPLVAQPLERLILGDEPAVRHRLRSEPAAE